ncbi:MAG: hypothetical protein CMLOHMNK_02955 [Steroidobacteraceae bacterium]|nr:hypothetical protein [Steroidobacteraceae bacterium]
MNKVVTVNLNGIAYQVEEAGYEALQAYLDLARSKLAGNVDCAEIVTDLEQAIADKCDTFLGANHNVVSATEMSQILQEMGPVEPSPEPGPADPSSAGTSQGGPSQAAPTRRLYRLPEQGVFGGVCAGLAAYFNVDVVWVRLIFVALVFFTGVWFAVWLVMLFVMPRATTPEEIALAHGAPFNAQDVINRAKKKYEEYGSAAAAFGRRQWAKHEPSVKSAASKVNHVIDDLGAKLRAGRAGGMHRTAHRRRRAAARARVSQQPGPPGYGAQVLAGIALPVLSTISAALFVALLAALLLLTDDRSMVGWMPEMFGPRWILPVLLLIAYLIVAMPLGAARSASRRYANGGGHFGWASVVDGLLWLAVAAALAWGVYQFVPGVQSAMAQLCGASGGLLAMI